MADKLQITIVGLGVIGASAGLALRRYPDKVRVVGHDKDPGVSGLAKSKGAVERTEWNLINATRGADRIILAVGPTEARDSLKVIGQDLKPGCVILNMSGVAGAALEWAAESLPANVHLVSGFPIYLGETLDTDAGRADLFQGKMFCLTPDAKAEGVAATLAADLVEAMGGIPFFLDPTEYDGLIAAVEHLPLLMSGALLQVTTSHSVWSDMRKLAGSQYYGSTLVMSDNAESAAGAVVANRENVVRWLDYLAGVLDEWRDLVANGDEQALTEAFESGLAARRRWLIAQASGNWLEETGPEAPRAGDYLRGLIGFRRPQRDNDKKKGR
jgi:prephenate dehydrogenase